MNSNRRTPMAPQPEMIAAVQSGDVATVRTMLQQDPALGSAKDANGVTVRILSAAECRILLQHCPDCCDVARLHGRDHLWLGCHRCPPIAVHAYESENSSMAENAPARRSEIANAQGSTTMISLQGGRMRSIRLLVAVSVVSFSAMYAQQPALAPGVQKYVRVNSPRVILTHIRVIDGTGKPAVEDQNVTIEGGKISAIQAGADIPSA